MYQHQTGAVPGSEKFPIQCGVRQGDVLSPLLFNAVLEHAMRKWKRKLTNEGLRLGQDTRLTNLRNADGLMIFATSRENRCSWRKRKVLTTPPLQEDNMLKYVGLWLLFWPHEEIFLTANGHRFFLSGGSIGRHGVGIVVGRSLYQRMSNVVFHAYSDRLCSLHFTLENVFFQVFSCYMPTSREPYHEVEQMYDLMELLLSNCERVGASAVVGGDFNAMLGDCREAHDRDVLGTCGYGERNDRGWMMAHWVARTGVLVQSRLDPYVSVEDSWTCRHAMDGQLVQIDYILSTGNLALVTCKYDHSMPVGLDPRCVHCILQLCVGKRKKLKKRISFKNWRPQLDHKHAPTPYQNPTVAKLKSGYC